MKRHALFVGVNAYDDKTIRQLRYSIPDASVLADRFKGFGYSTRLLADPTGAELKAAVMESTEGLGSGDVFLFFFAGHGFTSQDGAHLLFCRDDMQRLLRVNAAGIRVDAIEELTSGGGFHRAFLLDSCRSDCLAGVECRGGATSRDLDLVSLPARDGCSGSFFLLRSCDRFRPSLEFEAIGHGVFTQGLLNAMDVHDARLANCDTAFALAVGGMMESIQRDNNVSELQRPSVGECSGQLFSLFDNGYFSAKTTDAVTSSENLSKHVVCPICGKYNLITQTFKCNLCGRSNICLSHFSKDQCCCADCAEGAVARRQEKAMILFEKAEDCYHGRNGVRRDYVEAVNLYAQAAKLGHREALYNLGWAYDSGEGIAQDSAEAMFWYRKASEKGHAKAKRAIGTLYYNGEGVVRDRHEALSWYLSAAELGDAKAQYFLSDMYYEGEDVEEDLEAATLWCRKAAEQGYADAQNKLGDWYLNGDVVEEDVNAAQFWFRKAAEQGNSEAQSNLAFCLEEAGDIEAAAGWYLKAARGGHDSALEKLMELIQSGDERFFDKDDVLELFYEAAKNGRAQAQYFLGRMYHDGLILGKNYEEAFKWFKMAAEQGEYYAQCALGDCYSLGEGVPVDYKSAVMWYRKAAIPNDNGIGGNEEPLLKIGECYDKGWRGEDAEVFYRLGAWCYGEEDYKDAEKWYLLSAEQGNERAQDSLGKIYESGLLGRKDDRKAFVWYQRAAEQGNVHAQKSIGKMYYSGKGVEQNYVEAVKWLRKAVCDEFECELNSEALVSLGVCYVNGYGVDQDYAEAMSLFRKGTKSIVNSNAWYYLGLMYEQGRGVVQDYKEAVKCFAKAAEVGVDAEDGNEMAKKELGCLFAKDVLSEGGAHRWNALGYSKDYVAEMISFAAREGCVEAKGAEHLIDAEPPSLMGALNEINEDREKGAMRGTEKVFSTILGSCSENVMVKEGQKLEITGSCSGNVHVSDGSTLICHGSCSGNVEIEPDACFVCHGSMSGNVRNHGGIVTILGDFTGMRTDD